MAISPDGKILYVPSFEGAHWNVVDAETGDMSAKIETRSGSHNTGDSGLWLFTGKGGGAFNPGVLAPFNTGETVSNSFAVADFNVDGNLDVVGADHHRLCRAARQRRRHVRAGGLYHGARPEVFGM